jgi:hypothetical protein
VGKADRWRRLSPHEQGRLASETLEISALARKYFSHPFPVGKLSPIPGHPRFVYFNGRFFMKYSKSQFTLMVALPFIISAICFLSPLSGQEAKAKAKAKGRLPPYYTQIVDAKQREQIYAIQAKHKETIDKLEAELKAANDKLKDEIEAVLSKEQKDKLVKLRDEAKSKGKANAAESSKEDAKEEAKSQ